MFVIVPSRASCMRQDSRYRPHTRTPFPQARGERRPRPCLVFPTRAAGTDLPGLPCPPRAGGVGEPPPLSAGGRCHLARSAGRRRGRRTKPRREAGAGPGHTRRRRLTLALPANMAAAAAAVKVSAGPRRRHGLGRKRWWPPASPLLHPPGAAPAALSGGRRERGRHGGRRWAECRPPPPAWHPRPPPCLLGASALALPPGRGEFLIFSFSFFPKN